MFRSIGTGSRRSDCNPFLEMLDEAIQLPVIELDQFPDLEIEDLLQFRDLHDVDMLWLDEIFEMDRGKGPLSRKGEEIQEISVVTPILIGPDMFEKERGPFESLRNFEMVITDLFVMGDVFRPDPGRFEELHRSVNFR